MPNRANILDSKEVSAKLLFPNYGKFPNNKVI